MALGAQPRHILKLIVGQGMSLALIGIGIGLAAAFILSRYLTSMVYKISVTDPTTFSTWTEFDRHHRAAFVERVTQLVARVGS